MIYQLSNNSAIKASYSSSVGDERDKRLQAYRDAIKARLEKF